MKKNDLQNPFEGLTGVALQTALNENSDYIYDDEIFDRPITDSDREQINNEMIELMDLRKRKALELKRLTAAIKKTIKEATEKIESNGADLFKGSIESRGKLFVMTDAESAYEYDITGQLIRTRPLRPNERQRTIHRELRQASNS